jgi:hypothetical protein
MIPAGSGNCVPKAHHLDVFEISTTDVATPGYGTEESAPLMTGTHVTVVVQAVTANHQVYVSQQLTNFVSSASSSLRHEQTSGPTSCGTRRRPRSWVMPSANALSPPPSTTRAS